MTDATQVSIDVATKDQNTTVPGNTEIELSFSPDGRLVGVSDGVDSLSAGKLTADISFRIAGNQKNNPSHTKFRVSLEW